MTLLVDTWPFLAVGAVALVGAGFWARWCLRRRPGGPDAWNDGRERMTQARRKGAP